MTNFKTNKRNKYEMLNYKSGDKSEIIVNNYRPISILPMFSKLLEK